MAFKYREGRRNLRKLPLAATSAAIEAGDAITASGATSGFFKEVDASGEAVVGIAASKVDSPGADGDLFVMCDISPESVYEVPPDSGSVAVTLRLKTADVGADARSVNIDASVLSDILITEIDSDANTMLVQLNYAGVNATYTGV